jgi:tetratricopeptide (TPR) repeat protein
VRRFGARAPLVQKGCQGRPSGYQALEPTSAGEIRRTFTHLLNSSQPPLFSFPLFSPILNPSETGGNLMLALGFLHALSLSFVANAAAPSPAPATTPVKAQSFFEQGEEAYDFGDCFAAINHYRRAVNRTKLSEEQKVRALFRTSYCYYTIGNDPAAEAGFARYLRITPADDEARMKYAQVLQRQKKLDAAIENAMLIKEPTLLEEAWLLRILCEVEADRPERAIDFISSVETSEEMKPVFAYWLGVANYKYGSLHNAREAFEKAQKIAPKDHWAKTASQGWIDQINSELKFFRGSLALNYIFDTNLTQQSLVYVDPNEVPITPTPNDKTYSRDNAYSVATSFTGQLIHRRLLQLSATLDASGTFYNNSRAYNSQMLGAGATAQIRVSSRISAGSSVKYLNARYNMRYGQDFLIVSPFASWMATDKLYLRGDLGYTFYVLTGHGRIFSPRVYARQILADWLAIFLSLSYTRARGQTAIFTTYAGYPYPIAGSQFSRYTSRAISFGTSFNLPFEWALNTSVTRTWTDYEGEFLSAFPTQALYPERGDKIWAFSGDLSRSLIKNVLTLTASTTYTTARSHGYQGPAYLGVRSDYNFDRFYTQVGTTLTF